MVRRVGVMAVVMAGVVVGAAVSLRVLEGGRRRPWRVVFMRRRDTNVHARIRRRCHSARICSAIIVEAIAR